MDEFAGLYNIFVAVLINLTVFTVIMDLYQYGRINLGISNIFAMFGNPFVTWGLLLGMHLISAVPFYGVFRLWADNRHSFLSLESIWDLSFAIVLGLFTYSFYYIPVQVHFAVKLPAASATMIVLEQLRLTMKLYAFIRSNVPKVVSSCEERLLLRVSSNMITNSTTTRMTGGDHLDKENNLVHLSPKNQSWGTIEGNGCLSSEKKPGDYHVGDLFKSPCPDYEKFLYFLYAPTLVYRDFYPRTSEIRWEFILKNVVELLGCIYLYNLIHHLSGYVLVEEFGLEGKALSMKELITFIFLQMITGGFGFILGFFILLQTCQNIGAELLRFGDREFYLDWWNSDSFASYYRKWNTPVQDFLYTYIYKEAKEAHLDKVNRVLPSVLVFVISSIFHEYVFMFVLQVFYPLILVLFGGFGMLLSFVPNKGTKHNGNLFVWWCLLTGNGIIHALYTLEHFARSNGCPPAENPVLDFFIPRSWTCGAVY
ncbi:unnamed protein product [Allacma fusca]|uniref:O-acyltransferase n=2 Tax=Allacma fusca TaxID=39272 RepID=A0A8J2PNB8_9HEXA|nr:unnamed protein product [Allacma fusca]